MLKYQLQQLRNIEHKAVNDHSELTSQRKYCKTEQTLPLN